jgi:hypothetical protein
VTEKRYGLTLILRGLSPDVIDAADRCAAEDAAARGTNPARQRSATVAAAILAEDKRRQRKRPAKKGTG